MVAKIRVAVESRSSRDFLVIARTDARTALGLDEALRRAEAYAQAGADMLFVESPESVEEMRAHRPRIRPAAGREHGREGPHAGALARGARGDRLPARDLSGHRAAGRGAGDAGVYAHLERHGSSTGIDVPLADFADLTKLMGFEDVWEFERRHADDRAWLQHRRTT